MCFGNTTDHEHGVETAIPSLSNKANMRNNLLASHPSECTQFLQPELNSTRDKCCQPTLGIHRETALHRYTCRVTLRETPPAGHTAVIRKFQWPRDSEVGINCLGSIVNLSAPKGGSGQGMFVPEESGKEKEKPANTQTPWRLVFHEVSLMMSCKKWVTPTCDLLRRCTAPECL